LPAKSVVWSDREGFNIFYKGNTFFRGRTNPFDQEKEIDYLVLTPGGNRIYWRAIGDKGLYADTVKNTPILEYYKSKDYIFSIELSGNPNNVVRLLKLQK
jgi:hypothetical protein